MRDRQPARSSGVAVAVTLAAALCAPVVAATEPSSRTFRVVADLGREGAELTAAELEVVWDGERRAPVTIESPPTGGSWRLQIYVDAPLATPDGIAGSLRVLADRAGALARLGTVELTVADPEPRTVLLPTRDVAALRRALTAAIDDTRTAGELLWLRQRFDSPGPADAAAATRATTLERALLERQDETLAGWLSTSPPDAADRALLLVRDGYDLRTRAFYEGGDAETPPAIAYRSHARLERTVAGAGWTTLVLALGGRYAELDESHHAQTRLAGATGGEVLTQPSSLGPVLERLARRRRIVFDAVADSPEPRPLLVRRLGRRRPLRTLQWLAPPPSTAAATEPLRVETAHPLGAIRLVSPGDRTLAGAVRIETIVAHRAVERVEFFVDRKPAVAVTRPPFTARIDLGDRVRPVKISAVAYGPGELRLGADELALNLDPRSAGIQIAPLVERPEAGVVEVAAEVVPPGGADVERLEFYWNDRLTETIASPPYHARLAVGPPAPGDFARIVAHFSDGTHLEAARLSETAGGEDRLRVNLVEVLALVTDGDGRPRTDLERDDFQLRRADRAQTIEGFHAAADLPLHLGLAIDTSGSMRHWLGDLRRAAAGFLERVLAPGDQAFLVDFNDRPRLVQAPTADREALLRRFSGLQARGRTVLYDAVLFSLSQFEGVQGRKALVVLTDGEDDGSRFGSRRCIRKAREAGIPIYVVKLGGAPDPDTDPFSLVNARLARQTGGSFHCLDGTEQLDQAYERIERELRSHYLFTFSTERALTGRERRSIRLEVDDPRLSVRTILGFGPSG